MVNGVINKLFSIVVKCEDVEYRVWLIFDLELVLSMDVMVDFVDFWFVGICNDIVIMGRCYWLNLFLEVMSEKVILGFEVEVFGWVVVFIELVESVRSFVDIGNFFERR